MRLVSQDIRYISKKRGFTLIELLVVVAVISLILSSVLAVFTSILQEWEREDGRMKAIQTVSDACSRIEKEISEGIVAGVSSRYSPNDTLWINMSYATAYNSISVPVWISNKLQYDPGIIVLYYLSNETGDITQTGNILWRSKLNFYAGETDLLPDAQWSKYYDLEKGRVENLKSIKFDVTNNQSKYSVKITATAAYKIKGEEIQVSQSKTVFLRGSAGK